MNADPNSERHRPDCHCETCNANGNDSEDHYFSLLQRLYSSGVPTYRDSSGLLTRHGCACCQYCRANLEQRDPHESNCLWLEVEAAVLMRGVK